MKKENNEILDDIKNRKKKSDTFNLVNDSYIPHKRPFTSLAATIAISAIVSTSVAATSFLIMQHHLKNLPSLKRVDVDIMEYSNVSSSVANKVLPSIVNIEMQTEIVKKTPLGDIKGLSIESGSGIVLSSDGYILTNSHVVSSKKSSAFVTINDASKITVALHNNEKLEAKIIGTDPLTDLAVIKVEKNDLTPAEIGNSQNSKLGDFVMALGSPLGLKSTVTAGIISGINREIELPSGLKINTIQTNASINEGNSGGALANANGEVIGINTLKLAGTGIEGIGFAIPIEQAKPIYETIIKDGKVVRPTLGIEATKLSADAARVLNISGGVIVVNVFDDSNAKDAGIKPNDIIVKIDNIDVTSIADITLGLSKYKVGESTNIEIIRDTKKQNIKVNLSRAPEEVKKPSLDTSSEDNNTTIEDILNKIKR